MIIVIIVITNMVSIIIIITNMVIIWSSNGGIFMASFELIGIPSYDGIFQTIILNLLLSDHHHSVSNHHHCFKPPSLFQIIMSSSSMSSAASSLMVKIRISFVFVTRMFSKSSQSPLCRHHHHHRCMIIVNCGYIFMIQNGLG